ncbi:MAG: M20 family metallopeptidase [Desulfovibrio sp.]|jgi:glutamate carboxypeptidase|nr:M20 family metallopeptidase [Desulfovibrio sp.]
MDITDWKRLLDDVLDGQRQEMLSLLERLVNMDSFTTDAADVKAVGDVIGDWMRDAGFNVATADKPPIPEDELWQKFLADPVIARSHSQEVEPGVCLVGHMDTVFPAGTTKKRPFIVEGDIARGPGVADMKAGLVANMFAARALRKLNIMPCPLTLFFSSDEELGSPTSSKAMMASLAGGRAVICSEPGGLNGKVTLSRKGSGHMYLQVRGIGSHAGRHYADGASAIVELAHKILAYNTLVNLDRGLTVNTGLISGGNSANSVAPFAEARIHITYRTLSDGKKVVEDIHNATKECVVPRTNSTISGGLRLYPMERSKKGDCLYAVVQQSGKLLGIPISGHHYESASDAGFCSSVLGIPSICSMGPEGDKIHSADEYLALSSLVPRCKLIALSALQAGLHFSSGTEG